MPRKLLRDGRVVDDDWGYLTEPAAAGLIVTLDEWLAEKPRWLADARRVGVVLAPAHKVEHLALDLPHVDLVAADFPGPSEGRGYSQGRLLRERYGFTGELRAAGYVRRDQVFFLARCGFNSFELPSGEIDAAAAAFSTFSAEYQPSNDAGLALKLQRR